MSQQKIDQFDGEYIYFKLADKQNPKTFIYDVLTKEKQQVDSSMLEQPILLGQVRWYNFWRQYAFYPEGGTVFEKTCMTDIKNFIEKLNKEHRQK